MTNITSPLVFSYKHIPELCTPHFRAGRGGEYFESFLMGFDILIYFRIGVFFI